MASNKVAKRIESYPNLTTKGRPKGAKNKVTVVLKEAILLAAEEHGSDGEGKDGLKGYLSMVARADLKTFCGLLGRILPTQMDDDDQKAPIAGTVTINVIWPDELEHRSGIRERGRLAGRSLPVVDTRPV